MQVSRCETADKSHTADSRLQSVPVCFIEQNPIAAMGNICYTTGTDGKGTACMKARDARVIGVYRVPGNVPQEALVERKCFLLHENHSATTPDICQNRSLRRARQASSSALPTFGLCAASARKGD